MGVRAIVGWHLSDSLSSCGVIKAIESFHSLIKRAWLNRYVIKNLIHAHKLVFEYIDAFYNTKRIHGHCNMVSPYEFKSAYAI